MTPSLILFQYPLICLPWAPVWPACVPGKCCFLHNNVLKRPELLGKMGLGQIIRNLCNFVTTALMKTNIIIKNFSIVSKDLFHFWKMRNAAVNVGLYVKTKQKVLWWRESGARYEARARLLSWDKSKMYKSWKNLQTRSSKTKYLTMESRGRTWGTGTAACFYPFYWALLVLCEFLHEYLAGTDH